MSRCFPFPSPGYEKKTRIDDTDSLTKEKHKEKKHKKDKKDKREGKDKKDKDRSKEKHREKKDRKEKHKERDKEKEKDRDKEKNRISDEKKSEGPLGFPVPESLGPNNLQNSEIKDSKYVQELARRIKNEDRASSSQMVQKVPVVDQRAEIPRMGIGSGVAGHADEDKKVKSKSEDLRKINGQRNYIDVKGVEKASNQNLSQLDQERVQAITKPVEKKDPEKQMEVKEKSKHKDGDIKSEKHKSKDREKSRKSKDKDRDREKKKEEKAKETSEPSKEQPKLKESGPKLKESGKDSLDFRNAKTSDILKLSNTKPPDPLKLSSTKPQDPLKLSSTGPSDPLKLCNMKPSDPLKLTNMTSSCEGNLGKRKELEMNGYLLEDEIRPSKIPRPLSSSNSIVENGRKSEPCQTPVHFASEKQGSASNHRVDLKEHKINGLIAGKQPILCPTKLPSASIPANGNGEAPAKPPHPDMEYLSQIFSVPKVEELPDLDDHEWLFNSEYPQTKKLKKGSSEADEIRQVWAETLQIESAGISALPYVIPY